MCLSLKQLERTEVYQRVSEKEPEVRVGGRNLGERKIQKFPSRERNYAVRRRRNSNNNNNNTWSHTNCPSCAKIAQTDNNR